MKRFLLIFAGLLVFGISEAKVRLPHLISDGMVVQRDAPVQLWGWADAGERVRGSFRGRSFAVKADRNGEWRVELAPGAAGGPFELTVGDAVVRNVMVGEVWVCSGQSNMELPIDRLDPIEAVDFQHIRHFRVPMQYSFDGAMDEMPEGVWRSATDEHIGEFSAAAFYFAKELHERYGVAIGLINNAIGGSPAEAWISHRSVQKYPVHSAKVERYARKGVVDSIKRADARAGESWWRAVQQGDPGVGRWMADELDDADWGTVAMPGYWDEKGVEARPGTVWFRREVDLPAAMADGEAELRLGAIVDADSTWVNGVFVGRVTYQYPPRIYRVPAGVLRGGRNVIAVRVTSNSGRGGFVEEKKYWLRQGDLSVDLSGDWRYKIGARVDEAPASTTFHYQPTGLYNGMLAPLSRYGVRGFLWYQGESNVGRAAEYALLMRDLIADWRALWGGEPRPFIVAQLPSFTSPRHDNGFHGWAEIRDVQQRLAEIPDVGVAVTLDSGEWNDIHPLDKHVVGKRLAQEARRVAYGEDVGAGPRCVAVRFEDGSAILEFDRPIFTNLELRGFTLAGADGQYQWARATAIRTNIIKVWSGAVSLPVSVRYAWADNPVGANLRSLDGMPAGTFEMR